MAAYLHTAYITTGLWGLQMSFRLTMIIKRVCNKTRRINPGSDDVANSA